MLYYFAGFNGYLLLGHYLRNKDWSLGRILSFGVPMFLVGFAVTFFGFRHVTSLPEYSDELLELFFYLQLFECSDDDDTFLFVG